MSNKKFINTGTSLLFNSSKKSSFSTVCVTKELTFSDVSRPTKSCNLKVAVFGLPIRGPVIASTSSIDILYSIVRLTRAVPDITPILFAIKAGVSLQRTVCFPKVISPKLIKNSITLESVSLIGITSKSLKYLGGLKKCVPQKCFLNSSDLPSANKLIGILEVFDVTKLPNFLFASTFSKICFFIFRFSTTTSIIQSASEISLKLSVKFPVVIFSAFFFS